MLALGCYFPLARHGPAIIGSFGLSIGKLNVFKISCINKESTNLCVRGNQMVNKGERQPCVEIRVR